MKNIGGGILSDGLSAIVSGLVGAMGQSTSSTLGLAKGKIKADVSFDEFNLDIDLRYDGMQMEFPTMCPTETDLLRDEKATVKLSGFIITHYVDTVKSDLKEGLCRVQFHFDH
jgi:NCS2 family nucleobase:cation symporter-2